MDTSEITNVLIFKDGYYYLTVKDYADNPRYQIIEEDRFSWYGIDRNGFEFASDAYAYIASLDQKKKIPITLDKEEML